jgi:outer membrane lipoprotein
MKKRLAFLISIVMSFQGCTYAISPELAAQADKTISFEALERDPDTYRGKIVILGGIITQTTPTKQGTLIEVIRKPLDYWGKPARTDDSGGKFVVYSPRYLDPLVYAPEREITVAAEVEGKRSKALGEIGYGYPVVRAKEFKLWPREQKPAYRPDYMDPLRYDPNNPGNSMRQY